MVHRAYDQRLMTSTEGTVSARVDVDGFLITPTGQDRKYLAIEDIVLVRNGCVEEGKRPSRAVRLHRTIYDGHPEINCIMTAQSPNATAFTVTNHPLDTKTIPESYVVLREVPLFPYGEQYDAPEKISALLSKNTSVILIQNDTVLTTGATIHQAFDRLEVADFSALSLIDTMNVGPLVPIGEDEVKALEEKFLGH
jgi:L-fuculose-phosphate aldolase